MKKLLFTLAALLLLALPSAAMSYEQARQQALFLTDKMAYELNLSEEQYEAAYEINLDYLMSVNTVDDIAGNYWRWRNLDMSYVLLDWQYNAFCAAAYFYRPIYWETNCWHFAIYARYPHRDYFYFGRPAFYGVYRGSHAWHHNGGRSWYHGRHFGGPGPRGGMRDGFGRGDFGHGFRYQNGRMVAGSQKDRPSFGSQDHRPNAGSQRPSTGHQRPTAGGTRPYTGSQRPATGNQKRESSTRTTVRNPNPSTSQQQFGGSRINRDNQYRPATGTQRTSPSTGTARPSTGRQPSFGGTRQAPSTPRSTFSSPSSRPTTPSAPSRGGSTGGSRGSFGGHR